MIRVLIGNLFDSKADILVNTVNCVGVMGKGIAKIFKEKYPDMFVEYSKKCQNHDIKVGVLYPYYEGGVIKVINFPTKVHWRSPAKMEYIRDGLNWFIDNYESLNIQSIAFPPLGCGNGGLEWEDVGPYMYQKLKDLPIDIEIYAPYGTDEENISIDFLEKSHMDTSYNVSNYKKYNPNWLLVLAIVNELDNSKYALKVGRIVFQKICYVLNRYGTELGLNFEKGTYGPYSKEIKKMITVLSNNNLIYERQLGNMIQIVVPNRISKSEYHFSEFDLTNARNTYDLFLRVKNTDHAEMITSIIYAFDELSSQNKIVTENQIYDYLTKWKGRYDSTLIEERIREITKNLTMRRLITVDYSIPGSYVDEIYY